MFITLVADMTPMSLMIILLWLTFAMSTCSSVISLLLGVMAVSITALTYRWAINFQKKMEVRIAQAIEQTKADILKQISDPKTLEAFGQTIIDGMVKVLQSDEATARLRSSVVNGVKGLWGSIAKKAATKPQDILSQGLQKVFNLSPEDQPIETTAEVVE